jgi:glycosyltransferase involved in cell wall biosynthesis
MTARPSDSLSSIRIHVHLRGADVALMGEMGAAEIWYFIAHRDLPPADQLPDWCIRVSPVTAVKRIFTTRADTIEIPEPLWARFLPVGLTLMLAARIARLVTGRPRRTVFYALENNDPRRALFGNSRVPRFVQRVFVNVLGCLVSPLVDRVAFGSPSAQRAYESIKTLRLREALVLTELPARPTNQGGPARDPAQRALFVGGLEFRKGVRPLLDAWEQVERQLPHATIALIGSGPLEGEVRRWVADAPDRRALLGQVPHTALDAHYKSADVLIAPSVRDGRWREQIGLQLREALVHGLTLVASDETGLADWLAQHGHQVIPVGELNARLGPAMVEALSAPLDRPSVRHSLLPVDGRVRADSWLHALRN